MADRHNSQLPERSMGSRILYWLLSIAVLVVVGTVFVLMLGGVQGSEIDPMRFGSRTFFYYRLPFTQLQITPTWYSPSSSSFETEVAPYLPINQSRKRHWQVAKVQFGAIGEYGDPKIMDDIFWIIEDRTRGESEFWSKWSKDHKKIAKLFWPIVSELGSNDAYLLLPEFVNATRQVETDKEFKANVIPELVSSINDLAADFHEAGSYERVENLAKLSIKHDPNNAAAFKLRSNAYRQLGKTELADKDLATYRELE